MKPKKAEGSATSMVYVITISLGVLMIFSALLFSLSREYGMENVPEFEAYSNLYGNFSDISGDVIQSQNNIDENNISKTQGRKILDTFWSESIVKRAWDSIIFIPKLLWYSVKGVNISLKQLKGIIPKPMAWLITTLVGLSVIFVFVKAIWEKRFSR